MTQFLDYGLDEFKTYEEYVESKFNLKKDYRYLSNIRMARQLAMLGFRTKVYSAAEFYKMKELIYETINPKAVSLQLYGKYLNNDDEVLKALVQREEDNLMKKTAVRSYELLHWITFKNLYFRRP